MKIGNDERSYEVVDQWGSLPTGLAFGTTHGVVEDSQGRIIIHHTGRQSVVAFDPEGNYLFSWGDQYQGGAHGIFLNQEDEGDFLYLSATSLGFVAKTTLDGREVFRIGTPDRPDIYDEKRDSCPRRPPLLRMGGSTLPMAMASPGSTFIPETRVTSRASAGWDAVRASSTIPTESRSTRAARVLSCSSRIGATVVSSTFLSMAST